MDRRFVPALLFVFAVLCYGTAAARQTESLTIRSQALEHSFQVEVAISPKARKQGLMYRQSLAPDHGMLFLFKSEQRLKFWMKNTLISLDLLFIRANGEIARIAHRAVPGSLAFIDSEVPVLAVLEVNGGTAERLGLREGDLVIHAAFARTLP
jgi:uncharacterized membrane protein (UPF0127 family)